MEFIAKYYEILQPIPKGQTINIAKQGDSGKLKSDPDAENPENRVLKYTMPWTAINWKHSQGMFVGKIPPKAKLRENWKHEA